MDFKIKFKEAVFVRDEFLDFQEKTIEPSRVEQEVVADTGFDGLKKVTVKKIPSNLQDVSSTTAQKDTVLQGKKFISADGLLVEGSMPNNGAVIETIDTQKASYTIPKGYHNGEGTVSLFVESKTIAPTKTTQIVKPSNGKVLSEVNIEPIPEEYIIPKGSVSIVENGSYNVGDYKDAVVSIPNPTVSFDGETKELYGAYDGATITITQNGEIDIGEMLNKKQLPLKINIVVVKPNEPSEPTLVAGLYQTGTDTMIKSWDDLLASGEIVINNGVAMPGVKLPDNMPEKNEYGFYFGVLYVCPEEDAGIKFFEDGSIDICDSRGNVFQSAPSKSVSYGQNFSDMSTLDMGIANFSEEGTGVSLIGMSFVLGEGVQLVGDLIMSNAGVNGVNFNYQQSLTGIAIPDSVTSIGSYAFEGCNNLTSVVIPNSVTSIGSSAFKDCDNLTTVTCPTIALEHLTKTKLQMLVITAGDGIIPFMAVGDCPNLTSIVIEHGVWSIYSSAFGGCSNLKSIVLPDSLGGVESYAFYGCNNLTDVYYTGTEEQWASLSIDTGNEPLTNATIHYNYVP